MILQITIDEREVDKRREVLEEAIAVFRGAGAAIEIFNSDIEMYNKRLTADDNSNKKVRHKYGTYMNVLLSDAEMEKLEEDFPEDCEERIDRLSEYLAVKNVSYKSHYAVIRVWARRDEREQIGRMG